MLYNVAETKHGENNPKICRHYIHYLLKKKKLWIAHLNQQCSKLYVIAYVITWRTYLELNLNRQQNNYFISRRAIFDTVNKDKNKCKHVIHDFVGKLSWKIMIVSNSLFFFVWKRKWMQFTDGGYSKEFWVWYNLVLNSTSCTTSAIVMICHKKFVFFKLRFCLL